MLASAHGRHRRLSTSTIVGRSREAQSTPPSISLPHFIPYPENARPAREQGLSCLTLSADLIIPKAWLPAACGSFVGISQFPREGMLSGIVPGAESIDFYVGPNIPHSGFKRGTDMKQPHEALRTNAGERRWSAPQVVDLDDRRGVEGGVSPATEAVAPTVFSLS